MIFKIIIPSENSPDKVELVSKDLDHFWNAFDHAKPSFDKDTLRKYYLERGTPELKGYMKNRIHSAEYLSSVINKYPEFYSSIRNGTANIDSMEYAIRNGFRELKEIYPDAVFPPVYFVIGAMNSAGTSTLKELIIGIEFYSLNSYTPFESLPEWFQTNLKSIDEIPHIVAHEVVHFQQNKRILNHFYQKNLLSMAIKEGAADFVAELVSGKHINTKVHEFANRREKELWMEFQVRMHGSDYSGWLYSESKDRPSDLGYWMGYKIVESYYQKADNKKEAIHNILNIRNYKTFLKESGYSDKFKRVEKANSSASGN